MREENSNYKYQKRFTKQMVYLLTTVFTRVTHEYAESSAQSLGFKEIER